MQKKQTEDQSGGKDEENNQERTTAKQPFSKRKLFKKGLCALREKYGHRL